MVELVNYQVRGLAKIWFNQWRKAWSMEAGVNVGYIMKESVYRVLMLALVVRSINNEELSFGC